MSAAEVMLFELSLQPAAWLGLGLGLGLGLDLGFGFGFGFGFGSGRPGYCTRLRLPAGLLAHRRVVGQPLHHRLTVLAVLLVLPGGEGERSGGPAVHTGHGQGRRRRRR